MSPPRDASGDGSAARAQECVQSLAGDRARRLEGGARRLEGGARHFEGSARRGQRRRAPGPRRSGSRRPGQRRPGSARVSLSAASMTYDLDPAPLTTPQSWDFTTTATPESAIGPITVSATGDTAWRVVLYSP